MIEEYLQGSVGQLLERARSLQGAISKPFPPEFRALVQTCRNEVNVLIDQFGKLLTDPRFKKANVQETRLRVFQRLVKDLDFIECVGFAALTRINDEDKALTKLIGDITEEIRFPLIPPVACCQSHHSDYFGAFTMLGLVHVPLLEARFLLHLPDLYHELCHFILTEENNPVAERYQQALERAISAATGHLAPMLAGSSRGPKAARDLALAWTTCWLDSWGKELFCDLFGVLAVGPAYAWAHLHLCAKSGQDPYAVTSPTHPPDEARFEVLLTALSHLKYQREASLIEKKWRGLHALKKTKNTADYANCFPRSVLRKSAEEAIQAYAGMNCRVSAARSGFRVHDLLNEAWEVFWKSPQQYANWEKKNYLRLLKEK
jgi:hypothetical protein